MPRKIFGEYFYHRTLDESYLNVLKTNLNTIIKMNKLLDLELSGVKSFTFLKPSYEKHENMAEFLVSYLR